MKKKFKILILLLVLVLASSCLTACSIYGFINDTTGFEFRTLKNDTEYEIAEYYGMKKTVFIPVKYKGLNITRIDGGSFEYCRSIETVIFPNDSQVVEIFPSAFWGCSSLKKVYFPENGKLSWISRGAFSYCTSLESIIIPDSVTYMDRDVFYGCDSLTIYCEVESKPNGWNSDWNSSDRPVYWYSETEPTTEGNYWHYVNGVVTVWEIE